MHVGISLGRCTPDMLDMLLAMVYLCSRNLFVLTVPSGVVVQVAANCGPLRLRMDCSCMWQPELPA